MIESSKMGGGHLHRDGRLLRRIRYMHVRVATVTDGQVDCGIYNVQKITRCLLLLTPTKILLAHATIDSQLQSDKFKSHSQILLNSRTTSHVHTNKQQ